MTIRNCTKLFVSAGIAVLAMTAQASLLDATVLIERAASNRTLTVRYNGATAALIELRVNGQSISTRSMDDKRNGGETSFGIDPASMEEGDNQIEIRLYNSDGKVIATQKTVLKVDRKGAGPVFLEKPRAGATVGGPVEIKLGMRQDMRDLYVSFFINDDLKLISNLPPYVFLWDTEKERNGWHEVQAWVVDKNNNTFKTDKMRLFVSNGGGRTNREGAAPVAANLVTDSGTNLTLKTPVGSGTPTEDLIKPVATAVKPTIISPTQKTSPKAAAPKSVVVSANSIKPAPADLSGTKAVSTDPGTALGPQNLKPVQSIIAPVAPKGIEISFNKSVTIPAYSVKAGGTGLAPVAIEYGTRLPEVGAFQIMLNDKFVNFDVNPRVEKGVPFTPFRHLFQEAGGSVHFEHAKKQVFARGMGRYLWFKIGEDIANVDGSSIKFELAPFVEGGRVLVPMSFMVDALKIQVQYDPNTGHVLVTSDNSKKQSG